MLTFSKLGKLGRLGNQVMQIISLYGIAKKYDIDLVLPEWNYAKFFKNKFTFKNITGKELKEPHYHHSWDWLGEINNNGNYDIYGYLQSPKYYSHCKDEALLKFTNEFKKDVLNKLGKDISNAIAISIRRGDFVDNPAYYQISPMYYVSCLVNNFPDFTNRPIIIFSDDFEYCKVHFECLPNAIFTKDFSDIEQLCLMTQCKDYILSNSTFSYCGALLTESKNPKVYRPEFIFSKTYRTQHSEKDYWPDDWEMFLPQKLDARDVTFMIPVSYDHPDRKQNLDLCVCMLQREFETNIIVAENKNNVFEYQSQWCQYVRYNHEHFHRTKMLNDMAKLVKTDYIVNYDCDNFIPPLQNYMMILELRKGADMVYPFDGQSARMPRADWFTKFEKYLDCGIVRDTKFMGKNGGKPRMSSVGHAMGWNIQSYWDGGGENEYFISFGPEDVERYERFTRLGYTVKRIEGAVYHMDHYCGPDSSKRNPFFIPNHDLLKKYRSMTDEDLRKEVDTWEWSRHYTAAYYETITEDAIKSRDAVFEILNITKDDWIIDAGCGVCQWGVGLTRYLGIDYRVPISKLLINEIHYMEWDLRKEFIGTHKRVNYCLCLEVAEHLPESAADTLIENLTKLSDTIIFSAAIPNQGGQNHINEQWQDYWAEKFAKHGYGAAMEDKQKKIRQDKRIALWYRQNLVIYKRGAKGKVEPYVLPDYWLERTK